MKIKISIIAIILGIINPSCSYLDVVPDNIATIEHAFAMRSEAEKYLYTCYSYMPLDHHPENNPALMGGDEMWALTQSPIWEFDHRLFQLARGYQTSNNPVGNFIWDDMYRALRDCNIFLENVNSVPDLEEYEKKQWIGEVKFLKAYYHFYLVRMYGAIPLVKENLSIEASTAEARVSRDPVDSCFAYIARLLYEAQENLQLVQDNPTKMLGRITKPIALSFRAKVLVTAASPLFNGNSDQATLINKDGTVLFNPEYDKKKWELAAEACEEAIKACHDAGLKLYEYNPAVEQYKLTDTMKVQMSLRTVFTEKWNSEVIWANTQRLSNLLQRVATPNVDHRYIDNPRIISELSPPLKVVEMFYTDKGVPWNEDKGKQNVEKYALRKATKEENLFVRENYTTAEMHFNREPRFYASLGFDGGVWYGQGRYDDKAPQDLFYVAAKKGQPNGKTQLAMGSSTGYFIKKYVHYQNVQGSNVNDYSSTTYPWPIMRLADLYLLYAEALNEINETPNAAVYEYIDKVRDRAGLLPVKEAWTKFSSNPTKCNNQAGMRQIIHQERLNELAFEAHRFWDIRRWKEAPAIYRRAIEGWDIEQSSEEYYYRVKTVANQEFGIKDYFWPIKDSYIVNNRNLIQNIGW